MTYETIDWDAEAQHLKTAFGVVGKCFWVSQANFVHINFGKGPAVYGQVLTVKSGGYTAMCSSGDRVHILYHPNGLYFELSRLMEVYCSAFIGWNSKEPVTQGYAAPMHRALAYLVMNSHAVAAAMNLTEHEKLEWIREYEERYGL